jgi:serine phosphatase RsbU (regulator of sigma subunit)
MNPSSSLTGRDLRTTGAPPVAWVSHRPAPQALAALLADRCSLYPLAPDDSLTNTPDGCCGVIVDAGDGSIDVRTISRLLDELETSRMVALVLAPAGGEMSNLARRLGPFALCGADAGDEAVAGRIDTLLQVAPAMRSLHQELSQVRTFGQDIGATFDQIDEEMRLAARLQRDFLPKKLPEVGPVRFAAMFRPATWVSGDIYEAQRLDEDHVGFYVADAVGHGLPAALLTMFIKRALPTKKIRGDRYSIVPPAEAITELNTAICDQNLSSCQFCTAAYFIINSWCELESSGGLLGVFPEETFEPDQVQMHPGDRLVLFSDGAEAQLRRPGSSGRMELLEAIQKSRHLPVEEMVLQLTGLIDHQQGSLHPEDDVTLLLMDVGG